MFGFSRKGITTIGIITAVKLRKLSVFAEGCVDGTENGEACTKTVLLER